jgi:hypothetical protein
MKFRISCKPIPKQHPSVLMREQTDFFIWISTKALIIYQDVLLMFPMFTLIYQYSPIFTNIILYLPMSTNVYQCLPMSTNVYQCLPMSTNVYQCPPMPANARQCPPKFTGFYLYSEIFAFNIVHKCLPMSTNVCQRLPIFIRVNSLMFAGVYIPSPVLTNVYKYNVYYLK